MSRGGGRSAPGVGERGWFPAHPFVSADRRTYAPAGTGPSSHDHISGNRHTTTGKMNPQFQYRHTTTGGTNWQSGRHSARHNPRGRYWHRSEGAPGGRQMQRHTEWKQVSPVARNSPPAKGCPSSSNRNRTDSEVSSHELNCHTKAQGGTLSRSVKSDFSDCSGDLSKSEKTDLTGATSAAQDCPSSSDRNRTDSEVSSRELNCHTKAQGGTLSQSVKSDFSDCSGDPSKSEKTDLTGATSAAQDCPSSSDRNRTDSEVSSRELNCHAKTQGDTLSRYGKSDFSSDCSGEQSKSVIIEGGSEMGVGDGPVALDSSFLENNLVDETSSASTKHAGPSRHSDCKGPESVGGSEIAVGQDCSKNLASERGDAVRFDICPPKIESGFKLKESLLITNKAKRNQEKLSQAPTRIVLRDGMALLKGYVSLSEQAKIVKQCQSLGLGHGGFYQPGYRDGAKLNLRMMCLGKNWDPETTSYADTRLTDGAKPPPIPGEFFELVERSIKESHNLISEECRYSRAEAILPGMSPDICIVNFYSTSGRLGLHQDRDESERSLQMGLPVVSVSIGDSAEFLYSDQRDVDKAEKVLLESGDVLIFGGKSRHVFHGVSSVKPGTAPKPLLEQTELRPGRLNLTFRKY